MIKLHFTKRYKRFTFWLLLTFLLIAIGYYFRINDYIFRPQHGRFAHFEEVSFQIQNSSLLKRILYHAYFLIDIVWAGFTLFLLYLEILHKEPDDPNKIANIDRRKVARVFVFFAVFAFLADTIESFKYWLFSGSFLSQIYYIKLFFYALCLLFLFFVLMDRFLLSKYREISRFLGTASLSIAFIAVVYLLLTLMPQGGTLVVALLSSGFNVLLLFFLLTFLAIMLAHYPTYPEIWWFGNVKSRELRMATKTEIFGYKDAMALVDSSVEDIFKWQEEQEMGDIDGDGAEEKFKSRSKLPWHILGFGVVYFDDKNAKPTAKKRYASETVKMLRRSLGILIYVAFFNIFLRVISQYYFDDNLNVNGITAFILIFTLGIYYLLGKRYNIWRKTINEAIVDGTEGREKEINDVLSDIQSFCGKFPLYFLTCVLLSVLSSVLAYVVGWSVVTMISVLVTLTAHMGLFIYFKICRTHLKYVFLSKRLLCSNPKMFDKRIIDLYTSFGDKKERGRSRINYRFGSFSNNIRFIKLMSISGIGSLILLIVANTNFAFASMLNPINIILMYIIFSYSIIFIVFKHVLYYHRNAKSMKFYRNAMRFGIPLFTFLFFGVAGVLAGMSSDLHELSLVPKRDQEVHVEDFLINLQAQDRASTGNNYFYVGSYGGGLKANLWNTLLFYELDSLSGKRFFHKTVALSGVSGGAVGIGNYASLRYNAKQDFPKMKEMIRDIGRSNVLSNEITYWLGKDAFREVVPFLKYEGKDRSYYSMKEHAKLTGMAKEDFNKVTYKDYWSRMYNQDKYHFPALITNTTSTLGKQGVAVSLDIPDYIFSGADNILEFEDEYANSSLSYFGAISTTNRFPLFSPTAKITSKGHYLDGGYFDNSGLLSVLELHDYFREVATSNASIAEMNPVFINIINSKDFYVARKLDEWGVRREQGDPGVGEFSAILETVVSIDKFPRYVVAKIKNRGLILEEVFMPHKIHLSDVEAILKGPPEDPIALMQDIEVHNTLIDIALDEFKDYPVRKWGVVEPPLARLLSEPAERYQEAMVKHHPEVREALTRILDYLETEKEVKIQDQERMKSTAPSVESKRAIKAKDSLSFKKKF